MFLLEDQTQSLSVQVIGLALFPYTSTLVSQLQYQSRYSILFTIFVEFVAMLQELFLKLNLRSVFKHQSLLQRQTTSNNLQQVEVVVNKKTQM